MRLQKDLGWCSTKNYVPVVGTNPVGSTLQDRCAQSSSARPKSLSGKKKPSPGLLRPFPLGGRVGGGGLPAVVGLAFLERVLRNALMFM